MITILLSVFLCDYLSTTLYNNIIKYCYELPISGTNLTIFLTIICPDSDV